MGLKGLILSHMQRWARAFRDGNYHAAVETNNGTEALNQALKYSYMPRKTTLTLTGIACLIVDQFLPDMYQNYISKTSSS